MMTPMRSPEADPFGTAALRRTVLDAWTASPARFREDANAEEELARGAYRDRVIIELAQNAADAALRSGVAGRLLARLDDTTLRVANTGSPLDAAGVVGLSTLRASTKREDDGTVGRFGVGFAAVLAVTDEPRAVSCAGGVRWSRTEAAEIVGTVPALADELARRGTAVPVLRLPLPAAGGTPDGYDTEVELPLRDAAARDLVAQLIAGVDDALLLALPGLAEVVLEVEGRRRVLASSRDAGAVVVGDGERRTRWRLAERTGRVPGELLADRPVEEPDRWSVTVAVPVDADGRPDPLPESVPRVVHAPTPTDDRTDLPALILGSFPLDSSRRRVVPGRLTHLVATEVATAYADLVAELASDPAVLRLTPAPLPVSEVDGTLHRAVVAALSRTPFVPPAEGSDNLTPQDVVLVDGLGGAADPAALAAFVSGLPDPAWWRTEPLLRLGARRIGLGEVVDGLSGITLDAAAWRGLYTALDGADLEALATLPVPLADGRVVRGARGVLLPTAEVEAAALAPLGLRIVAEAAAHPLLTRLGALDATAAAVLRDPLVRAAIDGGEESVAEAVMHLVAASGVTADEESWLAQVRLADGTGTLTAAGDLWLPGSPVFDLLDADPAEYQVSEVVAAQWGRQVLLDVGVRDSFGLLHAADVPLDDEAWHDLDDEGGWIAAILAELPDQDLPPVLPEFVAVRDLDLVADDRWPSALEMLATDPRTRPALVEPAYVLLADGSRRAVRSYTAWWLGTHARIDGRELAALCAADADPVVRRLMTPVPVDLDDGAVRALNLARTVADLVREPRLLLDRLADPMVELSADELAEVYAELVAAAPDPDRIGSPPGIRVPDGLGSRLADAEEVVVADGPYWLQLGLPAVLPGSAELADLLDLDLASDVHESAPSPGGGVSAAVPDVAQRVLGAVPDHYVEHDDLVVAGRSVDWWVDEAGTVHAATADGLARGLAWRAGRWDARFELAEALRDPDAVPAVLAERIFNSHPPRQSPSAPPSA